MRILTIALLTWALLVAAACSNSPEAAETIEGAAHVRDDGTLKLRGHIIHLLGIEVPLIERDCRTSIRPARCGYKPVLVLDRLVRGFVRCEVARQRPDRSLDARCTLRGERLFDERRDIAAIMLREGWAFTTEDAPRRYEKLELIARERDRGLWSDDFIDIR